MKDVSALIASVLVEPAATGATAPMPLSILNAVAFVVVQESVDIPPPTGSEVGLAESVQTGTAGPGGGGGGGDKTVTPAEQVVCPPGPETVIVKFDVAVSVTALEPSSIGETSPTPLSIDAEVAATVVHEIVEEPPPAGSEAGLAESVQTGTGGGIRGIIGGGGGTGGGTTTGAGTGAGAGSIGAGAGAGGGGGVGMGISQHGGPKTGSTGATGATGRGGGGGGGRGDGIAQQGGPKTWAKTCVGVTRPVTNAMNIPITTVKSTVKKPSKIGRLFIYMNVAFVFVIVKFVLSLLIF